MRTCILLCAGEGSKMWPYATIRPKAMIPVAARPLIQHTVEDLLDLGISQVLIAAGSFPGQYEGLFAHEDRVRVMDVGQTKGAAQTLQNALAATTEEDFVVLYGDVLYAKNALKGFLEQAKTSSQPLIFLYPSADGIAVEVDAGRVTGITGHPRSGPHMAFAGIACDRRLVKHLEANPGYFRQVPVGVMSPLEAFLEQSVAQMMTETQLLTFQCQADEAVDLDRPWDILRANRIKAGQLCSALSGHELLEGASIDPSADLRGHVRLGRNSKIGRNVIIAGPAVIGDDTVVDNGALLMGNNVIGQGCTITNACFVDEGAVVGNHCVINHAAELWGVIFDGVYLYHYMHIFGIVGERSDIGAATVCGSLRFDDGRTAHRVKGRREYPATDADATYIGDFCRTGVNVTFWPGKKVGCYSVVGAGTILDRDVPDRTLIYPRQELVTKPWGPEQYGW